ncbi:MAG: tetratricopeptide repeat protein [Bacteroidota bacterium]
MIPLKKLVVAWFLLFSIKVAYTQQADSLSVNQLLQEASVLSNTYPDSALIIVKDAYGQALDLNNAYLQARANCLFGEIFAEGGNHDRTLGFYFEALDFYQSIPPEEMSAEVMSQWVILLAHITVSYFELEIFDKAHEYMQQAQKSLQFVDKHRPEAITAQHRMYIQFNFGSLIIEEGNFDKAQSVLHEVQQMNDSLNDLLVQANVWNNMGIIHKERENFHLAKDSYEVALALMQDVNDQRGIARVYNNLGTLAREQGEQMEAIHYFERALEVGRESGAHSSLRISTLALGELYAEAGDHAGAYDMIHMRSELSDSIYSGDVTNQLIRLSFQNQIAREINSLNLIHDRQLDTERGIRIIFMFIGLLFLLLLLVTVLYARQKQGKAKIAEKMHQMEADKVRRETEQLINETESQKKELTEKAMYVIQQNKLIVNIASRMQELSREFPEHCGSSLDQMIADLRQMQDDSIWKEFEHRFRRVHEAFYEALNKRFPDLTPGEKKLAAFLRLNLSTKDISAITRQNPGSIKVSRSRLRNKLGLMQKENLITFLEGIEK